MSWLTGLSLTALVAAVAAAFSQIRNVLRQLSGIFVLQSSVHGGMVYPVGSYVRAKYQKLPTGLASFYGILGYVDGVRRNVYIPYRMPASSSFWKGPEGTFLVTGSSDKMDLFSLRWISDHELLIKKALEFQNELMDRAESGEGNFYVNQIRGSAGYESEKSFGHVRKDRNHSDGEVAPMNGSGSWVSIDTRVDVSFAYSNERFIENKTKKDPFKGLFFDDEIYDLVESLKVWFRKRTWYEERNIPWRKGVLLYGPGGTGKSSLCRVVAETLGIPLYQYYLNTLTDNEFMDEWDRMSTPCVVAMEDFDTVFHGREPVTVHKSLSFECVLNKISGISSLNGILLMVNTNHIENVDPALGRLDPTGRPTRPGRIDHILHLGYASENQKRRIAQHVLNGWPESVQEEVLSHGEDTTAAQFLNICINQAFALINQEERNGNLDS